MAGVLNYIVMHMRSLIFSSMAFLILFAIMAKTSDFRFNRKTTIAIFVPIWALRYFGLTLYLSKYLAEKYGEEVWFARLLVIVTFLNIFIGVGWILLLFTGNRLKNVLTMCLLEFSISVFALIPMILWPGQKGGMVDIDAPPDIRDLATLLSFFLYYIIVAKWGEPWLKRYKSWEPKHPLLVNLFLLAYFLIGMQNNIYYALSHGDTGLLFFMTLTVLTILYIWTAFFYKEKIKNERIHQELIRYDHALKIHSREIIAQSARIHHYHGHIKKVIEALSDKIKSQSSEIGRDHGEPVAESVICRDEMESLAQSYLEGLENHYREITVSKYSNHVGMNESLVSIEEKFQSSGIQAQIQFHHFQIPDGLWEKDLMDLIDQVADVIVRACPYQKEMASDQDVILQGGVLGQEMILSFQYPGDSPSDRPSGQEERRLRKLCRRMKADMDIKEEAGMVKIVVGIPVDRREDMLKLVNL